MYLNSEFRILLIAASFPEVNIERRKSNKQISTTITDKSTILISESPVLLKISFKSSKKIHVLRKRALLNHYFPVILLHQKEILKMTTDFFSFLFFFGFCWSLMLS